jgi:hypothetical protein
MRYAVEMASDGVIYTMYHEELFGLQPTRRYQPPTMILRVYWPRLFVEMRSFSQGYGCFGDRDR